MKNRCSREYWNIVIADKYDIIEIDIDLSESNDDSQTNSELDDAGLKTVIPEIACVTEISSKSLLSQKIADNTGKTKLKPNVIAVIKLIAILCSSGASHSYMRKL